MTDETTGTATETQKTERKLAKRTRKKATAKRTPRNPDQKPLVMYVTPGLKAKIVRAAKDADLSQSAWVADTLARKLG